LEPIADEIQRLRSCINDLIGVLAIPAAWAGRGSAQIVETLLRDDKPGVLKVKKEIPVKSNSSSEASHTLANLERCLKQEVL
jgi:hypothetical protein